jgi:hypothetical protein
MVVGPVPPVAVVFFHTCPRTLSHAVHDRHLSPAHTEEALKARVVTLPLERPVPKDYEFKRVVTHEAGHIFVAHPDVFQNMIGVGKGLVNKMLDDDVVPAEYGVLNLEEWLSNYEGGKLRKKLGGVNSLDAINTVRSAMVKVEATGKGYEVVMRDGIRVVVGNADPRLIMMMSPSLTHYSGPFARHFMEVLARLADGHEVVHEVVLERGVGSAQSRYLWAKLHFRMLLAVGYDFKELGDRISDLFTGRGVIFKDGRFFRNKRNRFIWDGDNSRWDARIWADVKNLAFSMLKTFYRLHLKPGTPFYAFVSRLLDVLHDDFLLTKLVTAWLEAAWYGRVDSGADWTTVLNSFIHFIVMLAIVVMYVSDDVQRNGVCSYFVGFSNRW